MTDLTSDLPTHVEIHEEGPREGFQIEPGPISTADKIRLIEALAETGLTHIQVCSFVNPRLVPSWADAEAVVAGFTARPGIDYTALWFNAAGLERALAFRHKLTITGSIALSASEAFTRKNLNRSHAENVEAMSACWARCGGAGPTGSSPCICTTRAGSRWPMPMRACAWA
jgi:hydroxymethylglutaryl-CoA lyase